MGGYKVNRKVGREMKDLLIVILSVLVVALSWLSWRNSQTLNCDDIVWDAQNQVRVCEITLGGQE